MNVEQLFNAALEVRKKAHAPYSKFYVGAALVVDQAPNQVFTGCNIENISYGATICAERTAVVKALSEHPHSKILQLALVTDSTSVDCPCGMCLQVLSEFCSPLTPIHLCNLKGVQSTVPFKDLMPFQFENSQVKK